MRLCGLTKDTVKLIAVTKFVDLERIRQAVEAGISNVGENRVQSCVIS